MYVIVVGGGKVGYYLSKHLLERGYEVTLIEKDPRRAEVLNSTLGEIVMVGDGDEMAFLPKRRRGISPRKEKSRLITGCSFRLSAALRFADLVDLCAAGRAGSRGGGLPVLQRDVDGVLDVDLLLALQAIPGNRHNTLLCWLRNAPWRPQNRPDDSTTPEFDSYPKKTRKTAPGQVYAA